LDCHGKCLTDHLHSTILSYCTLSNSYKYVDLLGCFHEAENTNCSSLKQVPQSSLVVSFHVITFFYLFHAMWSRGTKKKISKREISIMDKELIRSF
jgi:hypothetical protein